MPTVKVRNLKNEEVGDFELSDAVFGAELNEALIHTAVKAFLANARQGTVGTKTRGDVSGSGRKLWKQKGTGRARIASIRSPLWKGGGNVHGPQARDWSQPIPKKMRRGALRSALSERLREGNLIVVDEFTFGGPKTKEFVAVLDALGFGESKTLIVDALDNDNLLLSARNVKRAKVVGTSGLNIYDVLYHEKLVLSRRAAEQVAQALDPKRKGGGAAAGETEAEAGANNDAAEAEEAA
ncbi:MAG TPA: 50S ribosomal protein L4 [Pyrinomonadaceae bacterium]|nr:50S ribosomal protein L4 [Pyrinomonadaceae bacterium]